MNATETKIPAEDGHQKPDSLRALVVRAGTYLAIRELIGMFVRLAGLVLTMREIGPANVGIYSSALAYVSVAIVVAQMGTEIYLIRLPREPTKRDYDEAFTHLLISSVLITVVSLALTIPLGAVIRPVGTLVPLRVLLLSIPLNVLWAPAQAQIERSFNYRKMGLLELSGDFVLYGVSVPLAFCNLGAWALIAGTFAWQGYLLVGSFLISGLRYRLAFSKAGTKAMLSHGSTYSTYSIINTLQQLLVPIVVGGFCGAAGVGYVSFAQRLINVLSFAQRNLFRVGTVAIARARDRGPQKLGEALSDGTVLMLVATAIPFMGFGLVARFVVPIVFGPEWSAGLPLLAILGVFTVLSVFTSCRFMLFWAFGQNMKAVIANVIQLVVMVGLAYPLVTHFGPVGFGYATLASFCYQIYVEWASKDMAPVSYRRLLTPMIGLIPPVMAPLLPFPVSLLTLTGLVVVAAIPSTRRDLTRVVQMALDAILPRRRGGADTAATKRPAGPTAGPESVAGKLTALPTSTCTVSGRLSDDATFRSAPAFIGPPEGRAVGGDGTPPQ